MLEESSRYQHPVHSFHMRGMMCQVGLLRLLALLAIVLVGLAFRPETVVQAAPAAPVAIRLIQPDGVTINAIPFGDEWTNGYETSDGYTIVHDSKSNAWRYATLNAAGGLVPSTVRPDSRPPAGIRPHLRDTRSSAMVSPSGSTQIPQRAATARGNLGRQAVLVILAQFTNQPSVGTTAAEWNGRFFGATDSLKQYFQEVSYGQLEFAPAAEDYETANDGVVGWVTLNLPHPDTRGRTGDANRRVVRDAILAANPYVDYARFDANGDGYLTPNELHVTVIVAGYEASYGGDEAACAPSVWGHRWSLGDSVAPPNVDGVLVGDYRVGGGYTQFGEQHCNSGDSPGHMATIGIMCHEMGHDLGWPDLYDTDQSSEGVGVWSVMGAGSWLSAGGDSGSSPAHPDAWSKWYQGWLTPQQMTRAQEWVQIQQVESTPHVIQLLDNPGGVDWVNNQQSGTGEYFLVENRQQVGYDAGLPGCGLLIWHIDESRPADGTANADDTRRLVDLEEADGLAQLDGTGNRGDPGDSFPGASGNRAFAGTTNPNSRLYSGAPSNVSITAISVACAATMTAHVSLGAAGPKIHVQPLQLSALLLEGTWTDLSLSIANDGTEALAFDITEQDTSPAGSPSAGQHGSVAARTAEDVAWLSETPTLGSIDMGGKQQIIVTVDTQGLAQGTYTASLLITSNDAGAETVTVPVTVYVVGEMHSICLPVVLKKAP
jgi:M6 family metalloprotease-like protein